MADKFIQVRPVKLDADGYSRAFNGDEIAEWGVYVTDDDGLPMHYTDRDTMPAALETARRLAGARGWQVRIDTLDGKTLVSNWWDTPYG